MCHYPPFSRQARPRGVVRGGLAALALLAIASCGAVPRRAHDGGDSGADNDERDLDALGGGSDARADGSGAGGINGSGGGPVPGAGGAPMAVGLVLRGGVSDVGEATTITPAIRLHKQRISLRAPPLCAASGQPICLSGGILP